MTYRDPRRARAQWDDSVDGAVPGIMPASAPPGEDFLREVRSRKNGPSTPGYGTGRTEEPDEVGGGPTDGGATPNTLNADFT